jgi:hypothetical protein
METGKYCTLDRRRECDDDRVFSTEYVEWLEKKVVVLTSISKDILVPLISELQ